ncbi:hypothetical protein MPSEU_000517100 [Mayamaea pseudoterrestris]|nr:hypothetical protein MPSEU_000517100 [Mayamaea pseudoterrestris]
MSDLSDHQRKHAKEAAASADYIDYGYGHVNVPPSPTPDPTSWPSQTRRKSAGARDCCLPTKAANRHQNSQRSLASDGYESSDIDSEDDDDPSVFSTLGKKSMSKQASERKLAKGLGRVNDYTGDSNKIHSLKEYLGSQNGAGSKHMRVKEQPPRLTRRSSIASIHSQSSMSWFDQSQQSPTRSRAVSSDGMLSVTESMDVGGAFGSASFRSFRSDTTQPVANWKASPRDSDSVKARAAKTDQIIESLVWFSFHTPRTVLEDLIRHELMLWRIEATKQAHVTSSKEKKGRSNKKAQNLLLYTHAYNSNRDDDSDDDIDETGNGDESVSSEGSQSSKASSTASSVTTASIFDGMQFSDAIMRVQGKGNKNMMPTPKSVSRESALLFVDMSGFTRLSTILDVESFAKTINAYFDMIVTEVISHGGDILRIAGDALFCEWKVIDDDEYSKASKSSGSNPLMELNVSLASINDMAWDDDDDIPKTAPCVLNACQAAASIVAKYSDYVVSSGSTTDAMLNVHCGIGVGTLAGLHVGDHKEDADEEGVELRREFLLLGSAIDQVSKAADIASDGEVMISPEAILQLAFICDVDAEHRYATEPILLAKRNELLFDLTPDRNIEPFDPKLALQPYESLRMHCKALSPSALARLLCQMALYVHPVIRGEELALSASIQSGKVAQPKEALESRHRAEAELRSVFTIFIKAVLTPRVTGMKEVDIVLFQKLNDIMYVVSRELDRYSGHLRQFIVDDKGVVLIATFGLRGSTFPNMISNNGLPALFAIHNALKSELKVENRIGATYGKVYCGVVGGVRRHEFAVMGAAVNLAARLMASKENKGVLVDDAAKEQADARFMFTAFPPVQAKGYDRPVTIFEPNFATAISKRKKSSIPFVGRLMEKETIISISDGILQNPQAQSTMIFLMGESGMGKSALGVAVADEIQKKGNFTGSGKTILTTRSTSSVTEQRVPLSSYRKILMQIIHDVCELDGSLRESTLHSEDESKSVLSASSRGESLQSAANAPISPANRRSRRSLLRSSFKANNIATSPKTAERLAVIRPVPKTANNDPLSQALRDVAAELHSPVALKRPSVMLNNADIPGKQQRSASAIVITRSTHGSGPERDTQRGSTGRNPMSISAHQVAAARPGGKDESVPLGASLHRLKSRSLSVKGKARQPSMVSRSKFAASLRDDASLVSMDTSVAAGTVKAGGDDAPYFEKLCWVCEQLNYPYEYADIVGSQFLGLDSASPVTHVNGHVPTMAELVEFLALAFICIVENADLTVALLDDFQWVDSFSWKIFRTLCNKGKKLLVMCATRSHDKQALRRLSAAASGQDQMVSQMIEVSLGPLDFNEIRELIAKVLGHDEWTVGDVVCSDLFQRTGGLPVYVVQVLENIKRKKTLELDEGGMLRWTAEGLEEQKSMSLNKTGQMMIETFLSRFDMLDMRVRKILQTCAVLGLAFSLSDLFQVHPEMEEHEIEIALEASIDEMILVEHVEDDEDFTLKSGESSEMSSYAVEQPAGGRTPGGGSLAEIKGDRYFQFSHAMWRQNVLTTMLKERKIDLHRRIAMAMEKDQVLILEQSDISRLLTLFDHWKSCGCFTKTAQLALAIGARLSDWDLSSQSLELYEDALDMAFDSVQEMDDTGHGEWVNVGAKPSVLDYILRLHIRIGLCHQNLGDDGQSIQAFEDCYNIIKSASKIPGVSRELMMPIISSLCVLKLDQVAHDTKTRLQQEKLVERFVKEAIQDGNQVHIGRALAMEASYYARVGNYEHALETLQRLESMYDVEAYSFDMLLEYGRDFAIECYAESTQWYYLLERHDEAEEQAVKVIEKFLPLLEEVESDIAMYPILPLVQVLKLIGRADDANYLLKEYVINPYHESGCTSDFWAPLFNPLAYLLELIIMEEDEDEEDDAQVLEEMEEWVLDAENDDYSSELQFKAHCCMGEICWRLIGFVDRDNEDRIELLKEKATEWLTPIARYPHPETFLKHTAQALLEALNED